MHVKLTTMAWMPMSGFTPSQLNKIRKLLTIQPSNTFALGDKKAPEPIRMYEEDFTNGLLGVPRAWFFENSKHQHDVQDLMGDGYPIKVETTWNPVHPYEEQEIAVDRMVKKLVKPPYGNILKGGCGFGKTSSALEIARVLGRTTLVICHKDFLVDQWKRRIKQFWPNAKVGIVQQDACEFWECDIVIASLKSLSLREYDPDLYRYFGTLIVDECHRVGARTWAPIPQRFTAKYRLGLTATDRRKDGAEDVFYWGLGPVGYTATSKSMAFDVKRVKSGFEWERDNTPDPIVLTQLCKDEGRTKVIADELYHAIKAGRKILVMGERLHFLEGLKIDIEKRFPALSIGLYTGQWFKSTDDRGLTKAEAKKRGLYDEETGEIKRKMYTLKQSDKDAAEKCQVIFATKQTVEEGLDIWDLDCLFLVTPQADVEQAVGRIRRYPPPGSGLSKAKPLVVDPWDDWNTAKKRYRSRMEWYRSEGVVFPEDVK